MNTPSELLKRHMEEAKEEELCGRLHLQISYHKGRMQGTQVKLEENHPPPAGEQQITEGEQYPHKVYGIE